MPDQVLYNIKQLSKILNVSESWLYKQVESNRIPHVRLNSKLLFQLEKIMEWIEDHSFEPKSIPNNSEKALPHD